MSRRVFQTVSVAAPAVTLQQRSHDVARCLPFTPSTKIGPITELPLLSQPHIHQSLSPEPQSPVSSNAVSTQLLFTATHAVSPEIRSYDLSDIRLLRGNPHGGTELKDGSRSELQVKVGDRILFTSYGPDEVKIGNDDFLLLHEDDVLAVIE